MTWKLHNFFRSSTSFRVRAALKLKGLDYDYVPYVLRAAETRTAEYLTLNPSGLVPTLETDNGPLSQSLAILEWLDETHPDPPLLPDDPWGRARVRSLAQMVACDIHPVNNLRVLFRIRDQFGADESAQADWFRHWAALGFEALEARLARDDETGTFCNGDTPGLADLCLCGQVLNNQRFDLPLGAYPTIARIHTAAMAVPAFSAAAPDQQPDAV